MRQTEDRLLSRLPLTASESEMRTAVSMLRQIREAIGRPAWRESVRNTAIGIARTDPEVAARVRAATNQSSRFVIYVMPSDWSESDLPMNTAGRHGHHEPPDWDRNRLKVLVMRAIVDGSTAPVGTELLLSARDRKPIVEVTVALDPEQVVAIEQPPETVRWGGIPTPVF
jgi:hypothetical protein